METLTSIKEKLMQEAQEIVEARSDMMTHADDVKDLASTLDWVEDIIEGNSNAKTNKEKVMLTWQAIMTLFDDVH
ncbi:hypothetical protein [Limosilactobacillus reuteri]|uniref:hypothetical protein n=1 Tax=Limosilactobacillus reuteri TaxID=1598 RepID=UPI001C0E7F6E|nr:hypothetical protein [Limosilactobacillus reuteri]QWS05275.1 hypothetical protein I6U32_11655 [Limosilactobacillus reuteri]